MDLNKVPTAEEFFDGNHGLYMSYSVKDTEGKFVKVVSIEKAKEYAVLIKNLALEAGADSIECYPSESDAIINSFPDNLILNR